MYAKAVELADSGDEGATAALVAMLLGMRASEIVSRRVSVLDEDSAPGDLLVDSVQQDSSGASHARSAG